MPGATVEATLNVSTLDPEPGAGIVAGAKDAVIPLGAVAANWTAELNPPLTLVLAVMVPFPPPGMETAPGATVRENAGAGAFTSFQWFTSRNASADPSPVA